MKISYTSDFDISAMANYYPKHTGLPMIIWIDSLGSARKTKHNLPRIKIQNILGDKVIDDAFSLSISKSPQILAGTCKLSNKHFKEVCNFVARNYDALMKHWNQELDDFELKDELI